MSYRNLSDYEIITDATHDVLLAKSDKVEVDREMLAELVYRFEKVLLSQSSLPLDEQRDSKDPVQLELF